LVRVGLGFKAEEKVIATKEVERHYSFGREIQKSCSRDDLGLNWQKYNRFMIF